MLLYEACCQIWRLLPVARRWRLFRLWAFLTLASLIEAGGIAAWYPFVAVLLDRNAIRTSPLLARLHQALGFETDRSLVLFLCLALILILLICAVLRTLSFWSCVRFARAEELRLGELLLSRYLARPYEWFLSRNSTELTRHVLHEVPAIVEGCIFNVCKVFNRLVLSTTVCAGLFLLDPRVALGTTLIIGVLFAAVYRRMHAKITALGKVRFAEAALVAKSVTESISCVKEAKFPPGLLDFVGSYRKHASRQNEALLVQEMVSTLPGLLIETVVKISILLVALYLVLADIRHALALIAVTVVAIVRVVPEAYDLYGDISKLRFFKPALDRLFEDLLPDPSLDEPVCRERLGLATALRLETVSYRYPGSETNVLEEVSLELPVLGSLALVGETGAGKTTLADILTGVLVPRSGAVLVDGRALDDQRRKLWRNGIGYVPQQVYLIDDTVRRNIAFGVPPERIDDQAVRSAAEVAKLRRFIEEELPDGYETVLGERGVCLSGGQRQRIGIARALYPDPEVLIFDEATSALDNVTEKTVFEALESLARKKTIVVIAHRLGSVMGCDRICFLENGRVEKLGTYEELMETCAPFRAMVQARRLVPPVPTGTGAP